ncbi:MAG: hypothetical protein A3H57_04775 [Candidatus Taylorbacteria bacterium RIFCSPLOWO2_02_FULL_43_11]|uniref:HIT domain-containing protein n=1 Tax=Candidatus Taylorbacteria bacterium RIFCSPHIGHO2_02_FULL_43_32b TaxID=1802306 RepID=A0A1G2MKH9_9BACT|nr:MAG: hypothetical protein A2743_03875 [Candidatus Taylorbacteria bacterium RIFCSPHIGHO2_01_FULL_43_47]OHA24430.1 MAG: hypothetical protein A3C72_01940 [Candidatus Taylorbacteria bacterium RIFCSPHIGHO2_02_FULL_43_32b]OHA31558.1 MAG: hypothetical protein A3B08_04435 [Candidatus Taylorbacteria bacterium RIFCSPLOWO2_01_FULL_43_44]OHA35325.1 MAG: hypothetical protein A3H57_04775 [Candidatus Taylorbacteria bacterium RIFCSPLOWO2_02_FULL_43_11]
MVPIGNFNNMNDKHYVNTNNARSGDKYENVIKEIAEHKVCPFCPEHIAKYHKNPILIEGTFWLATDNMYPYKPAKNHLIFIHKTHIENISEIVGEAWAEIHKMIGQIITDRKIPGGSFLMRFGDTAFTGASVTHLHAHLIQSNPESPDYGNSGLQARVG